MERRVRRKLIFVAMILFGLSLFLRGFTVADKAWSGFEILLWGPLGVLFTGNPAWLANPLFFFALNSKKSKRFPLWAGMTVVLALTGLMFPGIPSDMGLEKVVSFGAGYFTWLGSFLLLFSVALDQQIERKNSMQDSNVSQGSSCVTNNDNLKA